MSRDTFLYIIDHIKTDIQKQTLTEEPISPVPCSTANAAVLEFKLKLNFWFDLNVAPLPC